MNRRNFLLLIEGLLLSSMLHAEPTAVAKKATKKKKRIIVVGAGLAGLAAAKQLQLLGHEVVVVEGRDRTGGRIHTSVAWPDLPMDLGASWIHGMKGNPISKLARDIKARMLPTSYDASIAYHTDGEVVSTDEEEEIEAIGERIDAIIRKAQDADEDQPLSAALRELVGGDVNSDLATLARFVVSSRFEQEYAGSFHELSAYWFDSGKSFGGSDQIFADGYRVIIEHLAKGLVIEHNQVVESIDYSSPVVKVVAGDREFTADHVLITLPLGVLKAGTVAFQPALPAEKLMAIQKLGMGVLNKCYLRFEKAFWPVDVDWIEYIPEVHGLWSEWVSFMKAANQPVLLGFNAADQGRAIEKWSDEKIVASAMTTLRTIYGDEIPEPIGHQITRWASDSFAFGSYSFHAVGSTLEMRKSLALPLQKRLFFAGEATDAKYFGTAHGAYLSGMRVAKEIHAAR